MERTQPSRARFGPFELDLRAGELHANGSGRPVVLPVQVFQVLQILIEHNGDIATREEIQKKLWPNDTVVEFDHSINAAIKKLRRTLDDSADEPRYIETIPRRGYRLMVFVEWIGEKDSSDDVSSPAERGGVEGAAVDDSEALPKAKLMVGRLTGKVVSHYRVLEVIGGGGMGLVYRAEDLKLGRAVALKFLPEEVGDDAKARERFEREAHAVSTLDHSNICSIYEFDEYEGYPFIVMQFLQGKTLRDHLADGRFRLTQMEGLEVAIQIAAGLEAAHEKGIVHRDIKPANIFITDKNVAKILDFGVAKVIQLSENPHPANPRPNGAPEIDPPNGVILSDDAEQREAEESKNPYGNDDGGIGVLRLDAQQPGVSLSMTNEGGAIAAPAREPTPLTRTGMKLGTAGYMSPEQIRGEPLDARTDIFSFGLVLYEMAAGERAFTGETEAIVHDAIEHRDPRPVRELAPDISPTLDETIKRCLEKQREQRFQSAAEIRACLEQQSRASGKTQAKRMTRRFAVAAVVIVVIASAVAGILYRHSHPRLQLTDKDTIVIAHFINNTGDAVMDDGLDWPLYRKLQESPYLNVLYPSKVADTLKQMKVSDVSYIYMPQTPKLTPELARDVCLRSDSRAYITGSIANEGNSYQIALNAQDCRSGKTLATVQANTNDRNQIIHAVGVSGHQLRRELGEPEESLRAFNTPLENETSWSLEALHAFAQGMRLRFTEQDAAAIPQLKRAVELDPNLAMAYMNLSVTRADPYAPRQEVAYMTRAFNLRERLSQRSRWFMEAMYYSQVTGELEKASATYTQWIRTFPADVYPHGNFSGCLRALGQHERAGLEAREAVRLTPSVMAYRILVEQLIYLNRLEDAKDVLDEATGRGIYSADLGPNRYTLAFLQNDSAGMQKQLSLAMENPATKEWALEQRGDIATYRGQLWAARKLYSEYSPTSSDAADNILAYVALGNIETGNLVLGRQFAQKALASSSTSTFRRIAALAFARAGAADEAEKLMKLIDEERPRDTLVQGYELPTIRAAIELEKNRPAQAIEILKVAAPYDLGVPRGLPPLYPPYLRGLAYLKLGNGRDAAVEFQKMIDHPGTRPDFITTPLSRLQLARAQVMMGDREAARKSYQDFLTLWKDADPDIPIYRQAKAEYKKLNQPPAASRQLPATSYQLEALSLQPSAVSKNISLALLVMTT